MTDAQTTARVDLTRPIIGMENRTPQEVFDIMADRIRGAHRHHFAGSLPDGAEAMRDTNCDKSGRGDLNRAFYKVLRDFHVSNMSDEDGVAGFPLVDLVSNDGCGIDTGEEQLRDLADELTGAAIRALPLAAAPEPPERPGWAAGIIHEPGTDCDEPPERFASQEVERLREAACAAHDTLIELNPSNYSHDDVVEANDAAVEAILLLADVLGKRHGKTPEWWAERRAALADLPQPDAKEGGDA